MDRLEGKIAIITGGAHGIGQAIVRLFHARGAQVCLLDIDVDAGRALAGELDKPTRRCLFVEADVASIRQVTAAVKAAASIAGRIDVLCNNAAYLAPGHNALEATEEEWRKCFEVSLLGAQNMIRETLPYMVKQRGGSIINISSVQGLVAARDSAAYSSMKAGLLGLTRCVAYDFGAQNIRANALCPGAIQTRISPKPEDALRQRQISKTFLGRVGLPEEVAAAALFLASDESSYITGAALPVDGGWTAM